MGYNEIMEWKMIKNIALGVLSIALLIFMINLVILGFTDYDYRFFSGAFAIIGVIVVYYQIGKMLFKKQG